MFQLHDTTRRRLCLAGFMVLGAAPALLIGGWSVGRYAPGYVQAESRQLSGRLGLDVKLGGLQYPRPGTVLYENIEVADPETGNVMLRCRLLEIAQKRQTDPQGQSRPTLVMTASQPEVAAASLDRIWQCLQRALEGPLGSDLEFAAPEMTLRAEQNSQTFTAVQVAVENLPGGTHAQIHFRLAAPDTPEPIRIRIVRNRQVSPPANGFELYTGGGELPCNVLGMGLRELKPLGPRCRFRGYIWANETPDGWLGEVTGQLVELDLGRLVSDYFPHKLAGCGEVTIQSARFQRGRLEEGNAIVAAGPGTIDRSLLASAVDRLGLTTAIGSLPEGDSVPYEQLAFSVTLDAQGVRLGGRCSGAEHGTILSEGGRCLLGESTQQPAPAVALVQTLVPQSAVQVPASRQTDWLLRHLPVPDVMSPSGSEAVAPHARVRLQETWQR